LGLLASEVLIEEGKVLLAFGALDEVE